ncbi:MAG: YciI family protein [Candidatus Eremiobacteraeota bacterium]|nr:YciI family protein [Candidatus Eremiobacteraeota bacterium]MCW5868838.1 YciI family protein [Candidatus Eremiobacteraeota bacterium]
MKYLLLVYAEEGLLSPEEMQHCYEESTGLTRELDKKGQFYSASPLQSVALATSVRVREGRRLVTDGPFAETREQLGGYFLIEAADLDEAIEIAGKIPGARWGTVEIRPVVELSGRTDRKGDFLR